ncbi:hypothetical protein NLM31_09050 [Bradyrhizobium sp. CCGUVB4N]|uniref:hypothetical protein n=1 Tax=Bradyrhizobium sp. CCGUVB4N TaxID=2949631 RepID=UPI0020B3A379|nr:hypothetical protein [Bradyrhizobium sp. CCGUVB4N]MCP3380501.1 hypothetical protein [Bradyrhizobium sp. CCGUVB4N]
MTLTVYVSRKSRAVEHLNQAYRVMAFGLFTQLLRYFPLPFRAFASSSPVRLKADADPHITTAPPGERAALSRCCNSRVQHLKQRIELQIEEIARLICEGQSALEATRLLNALTNELVATKLDMCSKVNEQTDSAVTGGKARRIEREYGKLYEPEQLLKLGRLFDEAVLALPPSLRTHSNRTDIAKLILGRASFTEIELGLLVKLIIALVAAA